ncbi:hypothetical protein LUZ60_009522 [Juncus effusus]|nr:hypothetical protein LUZ60_009522 [Juncus effusus]
MPLYHCDYCEKEFQDTPAARKRHLQGTAHLRSRKLYYDSLRVAEQYGSDIQPDGTMGKVVCQHFVRTGTCKFGDACKFFHPKPAVLNPIQVTSGLNFGQISNQGSSFFGNPPLENLSLPGEMLRNQASNWGNLPPSLQPPPEGGYRALPFIDWG